MKKMAKEKKKLDKQVKKEEKQEKEITEVSLRRLEIRRQIFHILLGITLVLLVSAGILNALTIALITVLGFIISFYSTKKEMPVIKWFLSRYERPKYIKTFPGKGVIFFFVGALIVVLFFPKEIALASIMVLTFGDSVSHLWGIHFGNIKNPFADKKFIEGSITGFVAGFMGAILFVSPLEAMVASLVAMFAEAIEVKIGTESVDDNLFIPFIAGLAIWLVRILS